MADVVAQSINIEASIERVWEVVMDPEQLGDWVTIHDSVADVPADDLKKGSRFKQAMKLKKVPLKVRWEIVECEAPKKATWNGEAAAGAKAKIVYALSEKDGATTFDYQNEFELPAGKVGKLAAKAFNAMSGDREAKKSLKNLKELIENGNG